jgi:hypothetical protein
MSAHKGIKLEDIAQGRIAPCIKIKTNKKETILNIIHLII